MSVSSFFSAARRFTVVAALAGLMSIALVACGGETPSPAPTNTPGSGSSTNGTAAQEVSVSLVEWALEPKDIETAAGKVRFTVTNNGQFPHDFAVQVGDQVSKTPVFQNADGTRTLEVDFAPGTYRLFCSVGDHATRGMEGELVVK